MPKKRKRQPTALITPGTPIEVQQCPACGTRVECATGIGLHRRRGLVLPEPGCFVVCSDCGTINLFDDALRLRLATREEQREAPDLVRQLQQWVRRERPMRRGFFQ